MNLTYNSQHRHQDKIWVDKQPSFAAKSMLQKYMFMSLQDYAISKGCKLVLKY